MASIEFDGDEIILSAFRGKLNDSTMERLSSLADYISDNCLEVDVQKEDLDSIKDDVANLIDFVSTSTLNDGFKAKLVSCLRNILLEIENADIFGVWRLKGIINETAGQILLNANNIENTTENTDTLRHIWGFLTKFNSLFSFAKTVSYLSPQIFAFLTELPSRVQ